MSLIALFGVFGTYIYIYLRISLQQYTFWALASTVLAFGCLFIGSGKQKVYQSLVNLSKVDYNDKKKKSNFWMTGVLFYSIAWPMVLASNYLYFVDLAALSSKLSPKLKTKLPFLNIRNQPVR